MNKNKIETIYSNYFFFFTTVVGIAGIPFGLLLLTQRYFSNPTWFCGVIFGSFILLSVMLILITRRNYYKSTFIKKKVSVSPYAPLFVILTTGWLTITCFGALTSALCNITRIHLVPTPEQMFFPDVTQFYIWHALELIPLLKINEVFNSKVPFCYDQVGVSWLLLIFKMIIVWIIFNQIYQWIDWIKKSGKTSRN